MLRIRDFSITRKLTWMNMLVSGSALLLACAGFVGYEVVTFRQSIVRSLSIQAQIVGSNSASALLFNDAHSAESTLAALGAAPNILSAGISMPDGRPFAGYARNGRAQNPPSLALLAGQTEAHWFENNQIVVVRSIVFHGKVIGISYIRSDLKELDNRLKRYAGIVAIVLAISLIAAFLISSIPRKIIAAPIVQLAETARIVSREKNYSVRAVTTGNRDEMSVLIEAFNEMLGQIQERDSALEKGRDDLEDRVRQRTAELDATNQELGAFNKKLEAEIAGRKLAEEELRRNEERLSLAVGAGQMGVWELNVVNDTSIRSVRHDEIFGYPTLQPKWGYEIFMTHVVPDDREGVKESFEKGIASGQLNIECRIRRNDDNSVRWISAQGRQIRNEKNEPVRMSGVITDITERKRAEEGIRRLNTDLERRTADLEIANKELEAFTYSVAHDLRAPLRHIDGFSKMLMEEDSAALSDEAKRYLTRIRQGTSHMGQLVDDLLNLARLGRQELSLQVTGLSSLVEDVLKDLKAENTGREIQWNIQPLPFVECDPGLMRQVFSNLLSNALKYTRPRKNTSIEVSQVTGNGENIILIRDNGVGFSMKYADKLFGVFQRLHRQEDFEGTGVGLATVQRIIRKHGGRVWAEAELDKGATFYFTLGKQKPEGGNVSETGSVRTVESEQKVA